MTLEELRDSGRVMLTVEETVALFEGRISRSSLHEAIRAGQFPAARRLGRRTFVVIPHLLKWLDGTLELPPPNESEPVAEAEPEPSPLSGLAVKLVRPAAKP